MGPTLRLGLLGVHFRQSLGAGEEKARVAGRSRRGRGMLGSLGNQEDDLGKAQQSQLGSCPGDWDVSSHIMSLPFLQPLEAQ